MLERLIKGLLIPLRIFPVGKIANVTLLPEISSPSLLALQHRVINANGVEDDALLVNFIVDGFPVCL